MASLCISTGSASVEQPEPIPGLSTLADHIPFLTALASLPQMNRAQLRRIADRAIECMDLIDGDPDIESNDAEDEELSWYAREGDGLPGCPASDPAEDSDPAEEDDHSGGAVDDGNERDEGEYDGCSFPERIDQRPSGPGCDWNRQ